MDLTNNIARGRGVTLWRQIVDSLRADIEAGRLKAGEQLPTEPELADRFKVNRHTVRRAMAVLVLSCLAGVALAQAPAPVIPGSSPANSPPGAPVAPEDSGDLPAEVGQARAQLRSGNRFVLCGNE